ncbi:MAG: hypothetical protein QM484_08050 [Woeseiaceae bacterium]
MLRLFLIIPILSILLFHSTLYASEIGITDYKSGVSHFKNKKYHSALQSFKKASKAGMNKSALHFNFGVTYFKLKQYKNAKKSFKRLLKDKNLRQIAYFNLGLIAEKRKRPKTAVKWYKKTIEFNSNKKLTQLANNKLDKLLKRKSTRKNKTQALVRLAFGNNDNITNAASNSPSNKSDRYLELFAFIKASVNSKTNFKASLYRTSYNTLSTEDFSFYSVGIDYLIKIKRWHLIPEISLSKSYLNNINYQNLIDYKITGKRRLTKKSNIDLHYRYSDINSQNILYDYLQGQRHQFSVDYKSKTSLGKLRLRYQLETNNRQNSATANYSPTRHAFRARLKHKFKNSWNVSEEIASRISTYGSAVGVVRKDTRVRLQVVASTKINKEWATGIQYSHTNNNSNIASENYKRNNIQIFTHWGF